MRAHKNNKSDANSPFVAVRPNISLKKMSVVFKPKIKIWSECLPEIKETLARLKDRPPIIIPYGLQLENNLWNTEPLRLSLHVCQGSTGDSFVTHQGVGKNNKINVWTMKKNKILNTYKTSLRTINTSYKFDHMIFIPKRWVYVTHSSHDLTLQVFSSTFMLISTAFTGRSVLSLEYNSKTDEILASITGGVLIWHFPVKQTDPLVPGQVIKCSFTELEWTKSLHIDRTFDQLIAISNEKIAVISTEDYQCQISFTKNFDVAFTACVLYNPYKYVVTGDKNGSIKVWSSTLPSLPLVTQFLGMMDSSFGRGWSQQCGCFGSFLSQ